MLSDQKEALIDTSIEVPSGPTISTSDGSKAQNRTYQDLLKKPSDEHNFEQLALSKLLQVQLDGSTSAFLPSAMYRGISFSTDGSYVMVIQLKKQFSYLVTYDRFPKQIHIYDANAIRIALVNEVALMEEMPKGFMAEREGIRDLSWRSDRAHTLHYVMALDGGDPANEVPYRDALYSWEAPFKEGAGKELLKTTDRFGGVTYGNDAMAVAYDYWWNTRN
jgi:hypothetical protein